MRLMGLCAIDFFNWKLENEIITTDPFNCNMRVNDLKLCTHTCNKWFIQQIDKLNLIEILCWQTIIQVVETDMTFCKMYLWSVQENKRDGLVQLAALFCELNCYNGEP